jgi:hypothetical protein
MTSRSRRTTTRQNDADLRPDGDGTRRHATKGLELSFGVI